MALLRRRFWRFATIALIATVVVRLSGEAAAQSRLTEAQAKAGFLYNCAMFVEWPSAALTNGDISIGIVGADPVAGLIDEMQGRKINGHVLRVKAVKPGDDPRAYQIVFVTGDDRIVSALLARVGDAPVLTVGERDDFTARGGVVRLYTEQDRLRFEINMTSAERAGLRVSAKMLGLAKIVR